MTVARLTVQRGDLTEHPLAERTKNGWQNGVTFYPDDTVTRVTELRVVPLDAGEPDAAAQAREALDVTEIGEIRAAFILENTRNFDSYLVGRSMASEREAHGAKFDAALAAHDAQVLRDAGVTFEYGDAVREADGTVWDHEGGRDQHQSDAWLKKYNTEHREEMGDRFDGSQIVRLRRVRQGEWQVVEADQISEGTTS